MIKRKTRYHVLVGVLVALVVVTAGSVIGSNMGFKATRDYPFVAGSETMYGLALPHNNPWTGKGVAKGEASDADLLLKEVLLEGASLKTVTLRYWSNTLNGWQGRTATCGMGCPPTSNANMGGTAFDFNPGEAYFILVSSGSDVMNKTLVGSHDPTFDWSGYATAYTGGAPTTMENLALVENMYGVAVTPNTKWGAGGPLTGADDLLKAWLEPVSLKSITLRYWSNTLNGWQGRTATCGMGCPPTSNANMGGTAFDLQPFAGYMLQVGGATGDVSTPTQEPYY